MWKVPLFDIAYDSQENKAVQEVVESKWLTMGKKTMEFEQEFSKFLGKDVNCTAVSSCSAALHMSLQACGIKSGDEVIISSLTFVANANVVTMCGADIVLSDIVSTQDWNMSVRDVENKITPKTKAIIIVHYAGYPVEIPAFVKLAKEYNLFLIEDVAHAIGATYKGQQCGTFGDIACFSFFSNKNLSTGEGGMFVTKEKELDRKAKLLRSHGMSSPTLDRHKGHFSYDVIQPGLNYRIDEIHSALGLVQLGKLLQHNKKRAQLVQRYIDLIKNQSLAVEIPFYPLSDDYASSYHIFPVLLPEHSDRPAIMQKLKDRGVQSSIHYPSFKQFTAYGNLSVFATPVLDSIASRILTLPLYPDLTVENLEYVVSSLGDSLQ